MKLVFVRMPHDVFFLSATVDLARDTTRDVEKLQALLGDGPVLDLRNGSWKDEDNT